MPHKSVGGTVIVILSLVNGFCCMGSLPSPETVKCEYNKEPL